MVRSTKQQTATVPAVRPSARTSRPSKTAKSDANGAIRTVSRHDGAPGLGHPIFDELIAELGDPRRSA